MILLALITPWVWFQIFAAASADAGVDAPDDRDESSTASRTTGRFEGLEK